MEEGEGEGVEGGQVHHHAGEYRGKEVAVAEVEVEA